MSHDRIMIPSFRLDPDQDLTQIMDDARNNPEYQAALDCLVRQDVERENQQALRLIRVARPVEATAMLLNPRTLADLQRWAPESPE
jgi:hypothetical protein